MHACKAHRQERESWYHTVIFIVEELFRFTKSEPTLEKLAFGSATPATVPLLSRGQYFRGMKEKECSRRKKLSYFCSNLR